MSMLRIVADDRIPFLKGVLEKAGAVVTYLPGAAITRNDLLNAHALVIRTRTRCTSELLAGTPVRAVATATIGTDHVDTDFLQRQGIAFASAKGCNARSVACYIASALVHYDKPFCGRTFGIVGAGSVGSAVKQYGEALGYRVITCDPPRQREFPAENHVPLRELLAVSDVVTLHVPLTFKGSDATYHMADEDFFRTMRPGSLFINAARGEVVKEAALSNALAGGHLTHAVLDVWENEPAINTELLRQTVLATPHIAGYSADGKATGTMMSVRFLSRFFGLGIDQWTPPPLPPPPEAEIDIKGMEASEIIASVIDRVYDFKGDDAALRREPGNFEKLRGEYPFRRDFAGCKIINYVPADRDIWQKTGFTI